MSSSPAAAVVLITLVAFPSFDDFVGVVLSGIGISVSDVVFVAVVVVGWFVIEGNEVVKRRGFRVVVVFVVAVVVIVVAGGVVVGGGIVVVGKIVVVGGIVGGEIQF